MPKKINYHGKITPSGRFNTHLPIPIGFNGAIPEELREKIKHHLKYNVELNMDISSYYRRVLLSKLGFTDAYFKSKYPNLNLDLKKIESILNEKKTIKRLLKFQNQIYDEFSLEINFSLPGSILRESFLKILDCQNETELIKKYPELRKKVNEIRNIILDKCGYDKNEFNSKFYRPVSEEIIKKMEERKNDK